MRSLLAETAAAKAAFEQKVRRLQGALAAELLPAMSSPLTQPTDYSIAPRF